MLGCLCILCMNDLLLFLIWDKSIYFRWEQASSFSLEIINISKSLFQLDIFVVINFALCEFKMLLQNLDSQIVYLFISKILNFLLHDSDNSLLFNTYDIINDNLFHGQKLLQLFIPFQSLALLEFPFNLFTLF